MHISKVIRLLSVLLILSMLCSCDTSLMSIDGKLMRPPYPVGDGKKIQEQLTKNLGNVILKYPKNGDYRSAIIQTDLTGDGQNESIVFYRKDETSLISLAILKQVNGQWQLAATKESDGGEVERVMFGDVNNDNIKEIIVGWTIYSSGANIISAYSFDNTSINTIEVREFSESLSNNISVAYTDMQIYDFDDDGSDEIIASYINSSELTTTAKLIEYHEGIDNASTMSVTDTASLDGHVLYYTEAKVSRLTDDKIYGVVLDGVKDNSASITEYIYWDAVKGDLVTPFYNAEEQAATQTVRNISITSRDIDSDGIVDIPVTEYMPGYDELSVRPIYLTTWYSFDNDDYSLIRKKKTFINTSESYCITWQSSWEGLVTCRLDEKNRIVYFYHYQKDRFAYSDEIFRIKVFTQLEWGDETKRSGYIALNYNEDIVFAASVSSGQDLVNRNSLQSYFSLI